MSGKEEEECQEKDVTTFKMLASTGLNKLTSGKKLGEKHFPLLVSVGGAF